MPKDNYYQQPRYIERSSDDDRLKPKEAAGWLALAAGGYLAWKLFGNSGDDERREAWMAEALKRFGYYKQFTTDAGYISIAKKWNEDHAPEKLPSTGGNAILVGKLNLDATMNIAKSIYEAKGFWGDDEGMLYVAISRIKNLAQLWSLNFEFKKLYKVNVFDFIASFTKPEEKIKVVALLDRVPYYDGGKTRKIEKPKKEWLKEL